MEQSGRWVVAQDAGGMDFLHGKHRGRQDVTGSTGNDLPKCFRAMMLEQKNRGLAIFPICKVPESHGIDDDVATHDCFDRDVDGVRQRVFLRYKVRSGTRAPPLIAPYVFYMRGDGLATNDNTDVDVTARIAMLEQSVDGDRCSATAH